MKRRRTQYQKTVNGSVILGAASGILSQEYAQSMINYPFEHLKTAGSRERMTR